MSSKMKFEELLNKVPKIINGIEDNEFFNKISSNKWSKQEILGHLCDSAVNNHSRFVRIILTDEPISIEGYKQNEWVRIHDYQNNYSKSDLLTLWIQLNKQILNIMRNASELDFNKQCILSDKSMVTLSWLVDDYINHMLHHIKQIES
ncbi:DinB family protein [Paenibacillus motobuensis]|uniref:DinB family protein n=1 Tax=Paenibacillus TaxID=44249 RepID=UPI00203FCF66|nr:MULTISPECIES: DinB family protein [Paenibacillus]MCM3038786.1 DinB family protein [Paenibacillus lutimineralis]MCM3645890.1 DinB family protein [Paenibacillus motobuensis]